MLSVLLLAPQTLRILFIGNSLLNFNDVPNTTSKLLESDGSGRRVVYRNHFVGHLEDIAPGTIIDGDVASGQYDVLVLQGAMVSSSMKHTYSQDRGIAMAQAAKRLGKRVILYVEWPRRRIDETEYTMNVYRGIAKVTGAELLPVCYVWNKVHDRLPSVELWQPDGNHATNSGSLIAAYALYFKLAGPERSPTFLPRDIDPSFAKTALAIAKSTVPPKP